MKLSFCLTEAQQELYQGNKKTAPEPGAVFGPFDRYPKAWRVLILIWWADWAGMVLVQEQPEQQVQPGVPGSVVQM